MLLYNGRNAKSEKVGWWCCWVSSRSGWLLELLTELTILHHHQPCEPSRGLNGNTLLLRSRHRLCRHRQRAGAHTGQYLLRKLKDLVFKVLPFPRWHLTRCRCWRGAPQHLPSEARRSSRTSPRAPQVPGVYMYLHTTSKDAKKIGVHNNVACLKDQACLCKTKLIKKTNYKLQIANHKLEMYHQYPDKGLLTLVGVTILFQTCIYFIKKYRWIIRLSKVNNRKLGFKTSHK